MYFGPWFEIGRCLWWVGSELSFYIYFERRQVVFLCWMQDSKLGNLRHQIASRLNVHSQIDYVIEDQAKTWNRQAVPMMSEHSSHLTSLPIGFRTCLLRYACLLLLILMIWYRQAIFESKWDTLSSSSECRIRSWEVGDTKSPADWMSTHNPTVLSGIKQKLEIDSPSLWWVSIQPTWLHGQLDFASGSGNIFLRQMQDSNPGSLEPNLKQIDCLLTNRLSYWGSRYNLELNSLSLALAIYMFVGVNIYKQ